MANKKTKVALRLPLNNLHYAFLTGEGKKNVDKKTGEEKFTFTANYKLHKDSEEFKLIKGMLEEAWLKIRTIDGLKGVFKRKTMFFAQQYRTAGIKVVYEHKLDKDGAKMVDADGEDIKIDTGYRWITASTSTTWADGKPKKLHLKGVTASSAENFEKKITTSPFIDVTDHIIALGGLSDKSVGAMDVVIMGNKGEGSGMDYMSVYLNGIQFKSMHKYEGKDMNVNEDMEYEVVNTEPTTEDVDAQPTPEETPDV